MNLPILIRDEVWKYLKSADLRFAKEVQQCIKKIELNPNDAKAHYYRGITQSELGNHQEAISDFNRAIKLNSNYAEAYYRRGVAKSILGNNPEAISDLSRD